MDSNYLKFKDFLMANEKEPPSPFVQDMKNSKNPTRLDEIKEANQRKHLMGVNNTPEGGTQIGYQPRISGRVPKFRLGATKSGQEVFSHPEHTNISKFSDQDFSDAIDFHLKLKSDLMGDRGAHPDLAAHHHTAAEFYSKERANFRLANPDKIGLSANSKKPTTAPKPYTPLNKTDTPRTAQAKAPQIPRVRSEWVDHEQAAYHGKNLADQKYRLGKIDGPKPKSAQLHFDHPTHKDFSPSDHIAAGNMHRERNSHYLNQIGDLLKRVKEKGGDPMETFSRVKELGSKAKFHEVEGNKHYQASVQAPSESPAK
jgi:hypothetical protein